MCAGEERQQFIRNEDMALQEHSPHPAVWAANSPPSLSVIQVFFVLMPGVATQPRCHVCPGSYTYSGLVPIV